MLMSAVDKIQRDFDEIGVNVDLRSIPYHVTTLEPTVGGVCAYRADGSPIGIAISHDLLKNWAVEDEHNYGLIYKILLHEIGHCFFRRAHETDTFTIPNFFMILKTHDHSFLPKGSIEKSAMLDGGGAMIPKALWPYYVKEIAGLDRINLLADLERYMDVDLMRP